MISKIAGAASYSPPVCSISAAPLAVKMSKRTIDSFFAKASKKAHTAPAADDGPQKDQLKPQDGKAEGAGSKAQQQSDDPKPAAAREQLQETTHNTGKAAHPLFAGGASGRTQSLKALSITEFEELEARSCTLVREAVMAASARGAQPLLHDLLVEPSWQQVLGPELAKPHMAQLQAFLHQEWSRPSPAIYPPKDMVFRAMNSCPFDQVRVVVLGQDPYHNVGQAMGLSFSVPYGQAVPPSLQNIYKELAADLGCAVPNHGNLLKWAHQGVLLLNAVFTVRAHQANSHAKRGWEQLTDAAVAALSQKRSGLVFLLWGRPAQEKGKVISRARHHVLTSAHPSPLSASRGFFGCKHFSQANTYLVKEGMPAIDWQIDNISAEAKQAAVQQLRQQQSQQQ